MLGQPLIEIGVVASRKSARGGFRAPRRQKNISVSVCIASRRRSSKSGRLTVGLLIFSRRRIQPLPRNSGQRLGARIRQHARNLGLQNGGLCSWPVRPPPAAHHQDCCSTKKRTAACASSGRKYDAPVSGILSVRIALAHEQEAGPPEASSDFDAVFESVPTAFV